MSDRATAASAAAQADREGEAAAASPAARREPILATKLSLPALRGALVARPRLTARIGEALGVVAGALPGPMTTKLGSPAPRRLTLIVAPAGFGKSTLISEWCVVRAREERPAPVAYLSLDPGDNDPTRFLTYVIAALQTVVPHVGEGALTLLRSPQPAPREAVLTVLLNDLAALPVAEPIAVVLDDYHLITEGAVHESVAFLLDHLPPTAHFVIVSRADPPLPLARLRGRGQMTELRGADLRCSGEEAGAFLNEVMELGLPAESVAALEARTEGWMAGLQLAALSLQNRTDREEFITAFTGSHRYIVDYLGEEVLLQQPAEVQEFLLRTSLLERLTPALCDAVTGRTDSGAILERLERSNLFLIPLDDERRWWRYHHLFSDMLRALRMRRETEEEHIDLHRRAAQWFAEQGFWAEAVEQSLSGRQFEQAAHCIAETAGEAVWRRGESSTLNRWLDRLPEEVVHGHPRLCLLRLRPLLIAVRIDEIERLLNHAERCLRQQAAAEGTVVPPDGEDQMWGEVLAVRAFVARFRDDLDGALALCAEAMRRLPHTGVNLWRGVVAILRSNIQASRGDIVGALEGFREAAAVGELVGDVQTTCISLYSCALLSEELGRLRQAEALYRRINGFLREQTGAAADDDRRLLPPIASYAQVGLASLALERNQPALARQLVEQSRPAARLIESVQVIYRGLDLLLDLYLLEGNEGAAREMMREWELLVQSRPLTPLLQATETLWARLALGCGDLHAVEEWAEQQEERFRESLEGEFVPGGEAAEVFLQTETDLLVLARLRRLQNRPLEALEILRVVRARGAAMARDALVVRCLAMESAVLASLDRGSEASDTLAEVLRTAEPEGYVRSIVEAGLELVPLLDRFAAAPPAGVSAAYASALRDALVPPGDGTVGAARRPANSQVVFSAGALADPPPQTAAPRPPAPGEVAGGVGGGIALHPSETLSEREVEVLRLVADGLSNPEIAERLFLSVGTVKRHVHNIFGKLEAANRVEAIARARAQGVL